jgi:hypothetical protein
MSTTVLSSAMADTELADNMATTMNVNFDIGVFPGDL